LAFSELGIELEWQGENEKGIVKSINNKIPLFQNSNIPFAECNVGSVVVAVNPRYFRPTEVELLIGNTTK